MAKLDDFMNATARVAQQLGIKSVVIVVRDPDSGEVRLLASDGAKDDLRETVAEKFGFAEADAGETGWP